MHLVGSLASNFISLLILLTSSLTKYLMASIAMTILLHTNIVYLISAHIKTITMFITYQHCDLLTLITRIRNVTSKQRNQTLRSRYMTARQRNIIEIKWKFFPPPMAISYVFSISLLIFAVKSSIFVFRPWRLTDLICLFIYCLVKAVSRFHLLSSLSTIRIVFSSILIVNTLTLSNYTEKVLQWYVTNRF